MAHRILIAEDDELQGEVLRAALASRGYEAEIVTDGLEAVRRICTQHYDLALLDYQLPEVDGLAAAQLLHDLVLEQDRPRLIAITAMAPRLSEQQRLRGPSFDAIVSKQLGLPALLNVIDINLAGVTKTNAADLILRERQAVRAASAKRGRRWLALVAALPALVMVGIFTTAFSLEFATLHHAMDAYRSAQRNIVLGRNTDDLMKSMQDVELSQKTYMATRTMNNHQAFEEDVQHVDQMLMSSLPLSKDASPGFDTDHWAPEIIASRLGVLTREANLPTNTESPSVMTETFTGTVAQQLNAWAIDVLSTSQKALMAGFVAVNHNIHVVLVILGLGIVFGLGSATITIWQRWRRASSTIILPVSGM